MWSVVTTFPSLVPVRQGLPEGEGQTNAPGLAKSFLECTVVHHVTCGVRPLIITQNQKKWCSWTPLLGQAGTNESSALRLEG